MKWINASNSSSIFNVRGRNCAFARSLLRHRRDLHIINCDRRSISQKFGKSQKSDFAFAPFFRLREKGRGGKRAEEIGSSRKMDSCGKLLYAYAYNSK